jgi:hypothetical protein
MKMLAFPSASSPNARAATRCPVLFRKRISGSMAVLFLIVSWCTFLPVSARQNPEQGVAIRPCTAGARESDDGKKPARAKKKNAGQTETNAGTACLEVHSTSLDVQEHVQSFVREQKWHVGDEQIGEAFLSFNMALAKEDLLGYTMPDAAAAHVQWRSGKVVVLVKTSDLSDGYARTIVSAHFEGFGESDEAFAMQRASWTLLSNGKLEAILISGLRAHYRTDH